MEMALPVAVSLQLRDAVVSLYIRGTPATAESTPD
jgi:hypothetical protein